MKYIALKSKDHFSFICVSKTNEQFINKVSLAYLSKATMQPKSLEYNMQTFLQDYIQVEIDIKEIKII